MPVESIDGTLNYIDPSIPSSLFRTGGLWTRRDADGSDTGMNGVVLRETTVEIGNARTMTGVARPTCATNGFELVDVPIEGEREDFLDHHWVVDRYYPACTALVADNTGARAYAFDHNIRSVSGKTSNTRIAGGQSVQEPIHLVHGDYTLTSAPDRLRALARPPAVNDTLRSVLKEGQSLIDPRDAEQALDHGRFAIINVWRNIAPEPVAVHPLALCDAQTVQPEDLVVFEIHYQDRVGENYFSKHAPSHRWLTYPAMIRDEALLIKQWDSAGGLARSAGATADGADPAAPATFSFHSAFADPTSPLDAPDRWSIEVRCMVIYD